MCAFQSPMIKQHQSLIYRLYLFAIGLARNPVYRQRLLPLKETDICLVPIFLLVQQTEIFGLGGSFLHRGFSHHRLARFTSLWNRDYTSVIQKKNSTCSSLALEWNSAIALATWRWFQTDQSPMVVTSSRTGLERFHFFHPSTNTTFTKTLWCPFCWLETLISPEPQRFRTLPMMYVCIDGAYIRHAHSFSMYVSAVYPLHGRAASNPRRSCNSSAFFCDSLLFDSHSPCITSSLAVFRLCVLF